MGARLGVAHPTVQADRLDDLGADGMDRTETAIGSWKIMAIRGRECCEFCGLGMERGKVDRLATGPFERAVVQQHLASTMRPVSARC